MWTIIKINRNKFGFLKGDFEKKLGNKFKIYNPKIRFQKNKKNKVFFKELPILGDYLFCFHESFNDPKVIIADQPENNLGENSLTNLAELFSLIQIIQTTVNKALRAT